MKQTLKALIAFSWAHQGVTIVEYAEGELIETDDEDLINVSTEEGWAEKTEVKAPTVEEIKAELIKLKIGFPKSATKEQLLALLPKE
ncbi:MAG TPA: hypothetical protein VK974_04760 [Methylophilaceae bacterium]|nr:hypothetical protein [Methylophilaceae bacterium]